MCEEGGHEGVEAIFGQGDVCVNEEPATANMGCESIGDGLRGGPRRGMVGST